MWLDLVVVFEIALLDWFDLPNGAFADSSRHGVSVVVGSLPVDDPCCRKSRRK